MRLVQMPTNLLHISEADLDAAGYDASLLAAVHAYLPDVLADRRGAVIFTPGGGGGRQVLMLLARRVGAALRDENIQARDSGGDMAAQKKRLCYLPGQMLGGALPLPDARVALVTEAACFVQDLEAALPSVSTATLLGLLDERLQAGLPTFINTDPEHLPADLAGGLRDRLLVLATTPSA